MRADQAGVPLRDAVTHRCVQGRAGGAQKPGRAVGTMRVHPQPRLGRQGGNVDVPFAARPTSIKTLEMERIHEMLAETGFNISETARRLGMHRRTLARKLGKRWVPES